MVYLLACDHGRKHAIRKVGTLDVSFWWKYILVGRCWLMILVGGSMVFQKFPSNHPKYVDLGHPPREPLQIYTASTSHLSPIFPK